MGESSTKPLAWRHKFRTPRKARREQERKQKEEQVEVTRRSNNTVSIQKVVDRRNDNIKQSKLFRRKSIRKDAGDLHVSLSKDEEGSRRNKMKEEKKERKEKVEDNNNNRRRSTIHETSNEPKGEQQQQQQQQHYHHHGHNNNSSNNNNVPITYEIMRSIITSITWIEQKDGLYLEELYTLPEIIKINGTKLNNRKYQQLQPFVNQCIDQMMQGRIQQINDLESLLNSLSSQLNVDCQNNNNSCHVVGMALLGLLNCCESLIPDEFCTKLMNLNEGGTTTCCSNIIGSDEIEDILSDPKWPQFKSIALITTLHHLAKLWKTRLLSSHENNEEGKHDDKESIQDIAREFAKVLLVKRSSLQKNKKKSNPLTIFIPRKKDPYKSETKVLILVLSSMMMTEKNNKDTHLVHGDTEDVQKTNHPPSSSILQRCQAVMNNEEITSIPSATTTSSVANNYRLIEKSIQGPQDDDGDNATCIQPNITPTIQPSSLFLSHDIDKSHHILINAKKRIEIAEKLLNRIDKVVPSL